MRSLENEPQFLELAAELAARHGISVVDVLAVLSSKEAREQCAGLRSLFRHPPQKNGKNGKNGHFRSDRRHDDHAEAANRFQAKTLEK